MSARRAPSAFAALGVTLAPLLAMAQAEAPAAPAASASVTVAPAAPVTHAASASVAITTAPPATPPPSVAVVVAPADVVAAEALSASQLPSQDPFMVQVGGRFLFVQDSGFDPYASSRALSQLSIEAGWVAVTRGSWSLAITAEWDSGGRSANARGDATSLFTHRLALGAEGRTAIGRRLYAFVKVAPSAIALRASIDDSAADRSLVSRTWAFGMDTTAGAGFLLAGTNSVRPAPRLWAVGEVGYGFATDSSMTFRPENDSSDPRTYGAVTLPSLRLGGPVFRLALALSF